MNTQKNTTALSPEEMLKMENDLLKAKLTAEFGMKHSDSKLDSEMENQWLNYVYDFEKAWKDAGTISIYDFLGKPEFKPFNQINSNDVSSELDRLNEIMIKNNIVLDTLSEYDDETIYKFITEEFFNMETDNMRIEDMNHCFIYEEFHPNHEYDLKNQTTDFLYSMLERKWSPEFDKYSLDNKVEFNNKFYDRDSFMKFISTFQEAYMPLEIVSKEICIVEFDMEKGIGESNGSVSYNGNSKNYSGEWKINFVYEDGFWSISGVKLPNFG